ncbi:GTP-binding protein of the rab/ypt [Balamuthia mandrillaris]
MATKHDFKWRLLVIGNPAVGKTSLTLRFVEDKYIEEGEVTLGAEVVEKMVDLKGVTALVTIKDTNGQERYGNVTSSCYVGVHGIMVVYDITDEQSFVDLKQWMREVERYASDSCKVMVVGNKLDRDAAEERVIELSHALETARQAQVNCTVMEASAKTGEGVQEAFLALCQDIKKDALARRAASSAEIEIPDRNKKQGKKKNCLVS